MTLKRERIVVAVDDTDDLTKATSTGAIAQMIADEVPRCGGTVELGITRHQLLVDDSVPYTSHNSSMAFSALVPADALDVLRNRAVRCIAETRAATSDPGLCIARVPTSWSGQTAELFAFGHAAQEVYCAKERAWSIADAIGWIELAEQGGDGMGIVGALAGVALRLEGMSGRFRGKWDLAARLGISADAQMSVGDARVEFASRLGGPVRIVDMVDMPVDDSLLLALNAGAKPMLSHGALTLATQTIDGRAVPLTKDDFEGWAGIDETLHGTCVRFEPDNDIEECLQGANRTCRNCLYRRWVSSGMTCALGS